MNILEHYVTNITSVKKETCEWGTIYKLKADVNCYGCIEKQKEFTLSQSDYDMVLKKGYYMG